MKSGQNIDALRARITELDASLGDIRRTFETILSENRRLKEMVRITEQELKNRRGQIEQLEGNVHRQERSREEAQIRVDQVIHSIDGMLAQVENVS